jgi:hypothetical protein
MSFLNDSSDFNFNSPRTRARNQVQIGRNMQADNNTANTIKKKAVSKIPSIHRMPVMLEVDEDIISPLHSTDGTLKVSSSLPASWDSSTSSARSPGSDDANGAIPPLPLANEDAATPIKKGPQRLPPPPPPMSDDEDSLDSTLEMPSLPQSPFTDEVVANENDNDKKKPASHSSKAKAESMEVVKRGAPHMSQRGSLGRIRSLEPHRPQSTLHTTEKVERGAPHMSQRGSLGRVRSFDVPTPVSTPAKKFNPPPPLDDDISFNDLEAINRFSTDFSRQSESNQYPNPNPNNTSHSDDGSLSSIDPEWGQNSHNSGSQAGAGAGARPKPYRVPRQKKPEWSPVQQSPELQEKDPTKFEELPFWLTVLFLTILGIIFGFVAVKVS